MKPQEWDAVMSLTMLLPGERPGDPDDVLRRLGVNDGHELGNRFLRRGLDRENEYDAEMAIIVLSVYGTFSDQLDPLRRLAFAEWHSSHEDVASLLGDFKSPLVVATLRHLARWVPDYLDFDEHRALAVKAVWALGGTPGDEAERALVSLLDSDSEIVRVNARNQLDRRRSA